MTEADAVLASYFRNNVLHLLLMPSLLACAFLNNAVVTRVGPAAARGSRLSVRGRGIFPALGRARTAAVVDELLEDLLNHGLLTASDGSQPNGGGPPPRSSEAVQLSVLARITVPILERYYLAISLLLRQAADG